MKFSSVENTVPAAVWFEAIKPLLQENYQLKICPGGRSMVPFLTGNRDYAVLSIADGKYQFKKNDIVLYKIERGTHVLHRVYRINKKGVYTLGDACINIEGPFQRSDILASADYIIRKGKIINRENRLYLFLVNIWTLARPMRHVIIESYFALKRAKSKVKRLLKH